MINFVLKRAYVFTALVTVQVPGDGERTFSADFRLLPKPEEEKVLNDDRTFLTSVVQAVQGIDIEEGSIPEGRALLDVLFDLDFVVTGLVKAYYAGRVQTLEKN